MILHNKDITEVTNGIIAHGVNCCGVMGKGVALSIRNKWPAVGTEYFKKFTCENKIHPEFLGTVQFVSIIQSKLEIFNCFTQVYYGKTFKCWNNNPQQLDYAALDKCLNICFDAARNTFNLPLHLPFIGTGLAGGSKEIVGEFIKYYERKYNIEANVHDFTA